MNNTVPAKIYGVLRKVFNDEINKFVIKLNESNKKGEGYLGQIFYISLLERSSGKELHFVIKQAFSENSIRDFHPIREVFLNEIYFYRKIWPVLSQFQEKIPVDYRFTNLAKCFGTTSEQYSEGLVIENFKFKGFVLHDKKQPLDKKHFKFIFKIYGKMHAMSFAFKSEYPDKFSELCHGIFDVWEILSKKKGFEDAFRITHEICLECLQPIVDDVVLQKYKHFLNDGVQLFRRSLIPSKYTAIIHGDCWSNNMMFKYNEFEELTDLKLLDFQLIMLGSPICDLSYCLYSGGTKEGFDDLDYLLQVYYNSLSESLKAYGYNSDDIYPFEQLKNDWKLHSQMGFHLGLAIWRSKLTFDEDVVDFADISGMEQKDIKSVYNTKFDMEKYQKIAKDIVVHFYENGFMY